MINLATAMALAPTFVALIEAVLAKVAPELGAEVARFAPTVEKIISLLVGTKSADEIRALILAEQYAALDKLVAHQLSVASA